MRHAVQRSSLMAAPALAELAKAPERRRIVEILRLSSPKKAVRRLRQLADGSSVAWGTLHFMSTSLHGVD